MLEYRIGMIPQLRVDENSTVPLYKQIAEQIGGLIRGGMLANGSRLPATREMAIQYGLNRTTVSAAYERLESDGLIRGHVGRGSFVQYDGPIVFPVGSTGDEEISFASSRPAPEQFPLGDFQRSCTEVISGGDAGSILQLGSPAGYGPLRRYMIEQSRAEGSFGDGDDLIVTNGCQQAIDLLQRSLAPAGSTVVVEDPVYHGLRNVFGRAGVRLLGVPVSDSGIDIEKLARVFSMERPRVVAVTPNFQNPTGVTMPMDVRHEVLRLVREHDALLIENDVYGDLRYEGEPLPTLRQLDGSGRTILIRSFSKTAFPGLRVGWVIAPARIAADLVEVRQWCDLHTDHLSQAILLRFAESGRLAEHLARVRDAGRERLRVVLGACEEHLPPGSKWTRPQGGMNLWVTLPRPLDAADLLPRARQAGVSYLPGRTFSVSQSDSATLRLSFGGLSPERVEQGVAILGRLFREELGRSESINSRYDAAPALV